LRSHLTAQLSTIERRFVLVTYSIAFIDLASVLTLVGSSSQNNSHVVGYMMLFSGDLISPTDIKPGIVFAMTELKLIVVSPCQLVDNCDGNLSMMAAKLSFNSRPHNSILNVRNTCCLNVQCSYF
jgi:hypothetical protein